MNEKKPNSNLCGSPQAQNLRVEYVPIASLCAYERNTRTHNASQIAQIVDSIREFGFTNPVLIDENNVIIAGHGRTESAKVLGLAEVPVIRLRGLTEAQVKALRIADNSLALNAGWDDELLRIELNELKDADFNLDLVGFSCEELDNFLKEPALTKDEKYADGKAGALAEKFVAPPFSVLDARAGYWIKRKQLWRERIKDNAEARANAKVLENNIDGNWSEVSILDPVLSEIIVRWFMPKRERGINCFDVFAGDTVFGYVSSFMGKAFTGIELREEQADFNNNRVKEGGLNARYICDDGRNVKNHIEANSQDLLFSCPPYFDLEVYSDKPNDASNQSTFEEFYAILDDAFTSAITCLKENRFAVIVVGEVRNKKDGGYYDFIGRIKDTFMRNGLLLYNDAILLDAVGTACLRAQRQMNTRKLCKVHQNVLIFYKGDTKKIPSEFGECDFCNYENEE